jgi:hypothetical protein
MSCNLPSGGDQDFPQCQLLSVGAVPVDPASFMEAVTHHALAKQKKDDHQEDYKQDLSNSERGWLSSSGDRRIHFTFLLETLMKQRQRFRTQTATRTSIFNL